VSSSHVSYVHVTRVPFTHLLAYLLAYLVEARVQVLRLDVIAPAGDERECLVGGEEVLKGRYASV
jgi:hypothetical protein